MSARPGVRGGAALYTPEILALAVEVANYPFADDWPHRGEAQSRVCGSRVSLSLATDAAGRIDRVGARVSACAIGQAAAALFLRAVVGRDMTEVAAAQTQIEGWLAGQAALPLWPGMAELETARDYPARHAAILLPWKAALAALSNPAAAG